MTNSSRKGFFPSFGPLSLGLPTRLAAGLLFSCLLLVACSGSGPEMSPDGANISDPMLHATMTETLDLRLQQLAILTDEDLSANERQQEHLRRINAIAFAADRLRVSAIELQGIAASLGLEQADRERFLDLAKQMESESATMEQAAQDNRSENLQAMMANINGTCATCHALYRAPAGR